MLGTNGHVTPRHAAQAVRALARSRALIGARSPVRVVSNMIGCCELQSEELTTAVKGRSRTDLEKAQPGFWGVVMLH